MLPEGPCGGRRLWLLKETFTVCRLAGRVAGSTGGPPKAIVASARCSGSPNVLIVLSYARELGHPET